MTWAPDYASIDELRLYLRLPAAGNTGGGSPDADNSPVYGVALTGASRMVDTACGRQFGSVTATARVYTPVFSARRARNVVSIDDLMTVTSLVVKADLDSDGVFEETITDYVKMPLNAAASSRPWTDLELRASSSLTEGSLEITAVWGWTAVPSTIHQATLLQASRIAKRRDSPFGVAGSPDMGNELRLLAKLDPDVAVMLTSYRRLW